MTGSRRAVAERAVAESEWRGLARAHERAVDAITRGHRERRRSGTAHPVEDFLFTYYSFPAGRLRRWHPGAGVVLLGDAARERLGWRWHVEVEPAGADLGVGVGLDLAAYRRDRGDLVRFVRDLLAATAERAPQLGCFGLHEWAMVYRQEAGQVRHAAWPLRLGARGTDDVVEAASIRCTHFDAYRFFTPEALLRNAVRPTRATQVALEQPGCLHATMDLYKWAYKLGPLVPGELLLSCFELARDVRVLDMRASPYDLSELGYSPVRIETPEGKADYVAAQRAFRSRAAPLRQRLVDVCQGCLVAGVEVA